MTGKAVPLQEAFWSRVDRRGPDECWEWRGHLNGDGYGLLSRGVGPPIRAHRVSWEMHNGRPIPTGLIVRHSCDNPPCINPNHLLIGTRADNMADTMSRGRHASQRQTHCAQGHPFSPENTYPRRKDGRVYGRACRACHLVAMKCQRAKRRASKQPSHFNEGSSS